MARSLLLVAWTAALALGAGAAGPSVALPEPIANPHSFEILLNSRVSTHAGFTDTLPEQVMANVLWAMSRAPQLGKKREFYVGTEVGLWRYDATAHRLEPLAAGDQRYNSGSAFEVAIAGDRFEDAGMATQAGLLAATAFRGRRGGDVVACPMQWAADHAGANWQLKEPVRFAVVFGKAVTPPLDTAVAALSSDNSLARPLVVAPDTFERLVAGLGQTTRFSPEPISDFALSQLLWAAYGPTPHLTHKGRQGLTVPSARAEYPLSNRIYAVTVAGVARYSNRLPGPLDLGTRDHRLVQQVTTDRRSELVGALDAAPPGAPLYIVVCGPDTSAGVLIEAGCVAFNLLAQARAQGLAGHLSIPAGRTARTAIARALDLGPKDRPLVVFVAGEAPAADVAAESEEVVKILHAQPAIRRGALRVEYRLERSGPVRIEVFDMVGRPVRLVADEHQSAGYRFINWDCAGEDGRRMKPGTYLVVITSRGSVASHKVSLN